MSYFPTDRDILTSSIWAESGDVYKLWSYLMLSASVATGILHETIPAIAIRCALPIPFVQATLKRFSEPDEFSRSKNNDGRRIEFLDDGILLINYLAHRDKDYSTPRVHKHRAKKRGETVKRNETRFETAGNGHETTETDRARAPRVSETPPESSMLVSEGGDAELTPLWSEYLLGSGPDNRRLFDRHVRAALRASKGKVTFAHVSLWMSANPGRKAWDIYEALVPKLEKAPSPAEKPTRSLEQIADDYDKAQKAKAPCPTCRGSKRSTQRRPIDQSSPYWRPEKPFVDVVVPCPECSKKEA